MFQLPSSPHAHRRFPPKYAAVGSWPPAGSLTSCFADHPLQPYHPCGEATGDFSPHSPMLVPSGLGDRKSAPGKGGLS